MLPVYGNRAQLPELYRRLTEVLGALTAEPELVFVDDGGQDGSLEWLRACRERDPRVVVVEMERNSGQHRAVVAGLASSSGDILAVMDADLQDRPEELPGLVQALGEKQAVVFARRTGGHARPVRRMTGWLFKRLLRIVAGSGIPRGTGMFFVASRGVIHAALTRSAHAEYVPLWLAQTDAPMTAVAVARERRLDTASAYSSTRRLRLALSAVRQAIAWRMGLRRGGATLRTGEPSRSSPLPPGGQPRRPPVKPTPALTGRERADPGAGTGRRWVWLSCAHLVLLIAVVGVFSLRADFPLVDNFRTFTRVVTRDWAAIVVEPFRDPDEYRPIYYPFVKAVYEIGGVPNLVVFRTVHLGMLAAMGGLVIWALRVRSFSGWLAAFTALNCAFGLHTSRFLLYGIPLNGKLMVVVLALIGIRVLFLSRTPVVEAAVLALSLIGLFLHEMGAVVGAVFLAGYWFGCRAMSRRTAFGVLLCFACYLVVRLTLSQHPVPAQFYTETNFLFGELSVDEQQRLFGQFPLVFYAYNVLSSLLTLLASEPRAGRFAFVDALMRGQVQPWQWINILSSLAATTLIVGWLGRLRRPGRDRTVAFILGLVVMLNCGLSFLYTRDRIPALAGIAYAVLLGYAIADRVGTWQHEATGLRRRVWAAILVVAVGGWMVRAAGVAFTLRDVGWDTRLEWTLRSGEPSDVEASAVTELREILRRRAVENPWSAVNPCTDRPILRALFERHC